MEFLIGRIVEGIIVGIVSSFIFQIINRTRKPKILIADKISKTTVNNKVEYRIKIVNLKRHYIKNMKIYVMLADKHISANHTVVKTIPLKISQADILFIDPYDKNDREGKYAIRIGIQDNLEKMWTDETHMYLNIKVYCENEKSSSGAVYEKSISKDCIQEGIFDFGKSTKII